MALSPTVDEPVKVIDITKDLSVGLFADGKVMTMIHGLPFIQCRKAILVVKREGDIADRMHEYSNMDEVLGGRNIHEVELDDVHVDPETELFVHASSIQGWVDSGYNIDVIDTRIAFPILLELSKTDEGAKNALFFEVERRWNEGSETSRRALVERARTVVEFIELSKKELSSLAQYEIERLAQNPYFTRRLAKAMLALPEKDKGIVFTITSNPVVDFAMILGFVSNARKGEEMLHVTAMVGAWSNTSVSDAEHRRLYAVVTRQVAGAWPSWSMEQREAICYFVTSRVSYLSSCNRFRTDFDGFVGGLVFKAYEENDVVFMDGYVEYLESFGPARSLSIYKVFGNELKERRIFGGLERDPNRVAEYLSGSVYEGLGEKERAIVLYNCSGLLAVHLVAGGRVAVSDLPPGTFSRFLSRLAEFSTTDVTGIMAKHGKTIWDMASENDRQLIVDKLGDEWEGGELHEVYRWECDVCGEPQQSIEYPDSYTCDECLAKVRVKRKLAGAKRT